MIIIAGIAAHATTDSTVAVFGLESGILKEEILLSHDAAITQATPQAAAKPMSQTVGGMTTWAADVDAASSCADVDADSCAADVDAASADSPQMAPSAAATTKASVMQSAEGATVKLTNPVGQAALTMRPLELNPTFWQIQVRRRLNHNVHILLCVSRRKIRNSFLIPIGLL